MKHLARDDWKPYTFPLYEYYYAYILYIASLDVGNTLTRVSLPLLSILESTILSTEQSSTLNALLAL